MSAYTAIGLRSRARAVFAVVASIGALALLWAIRPSFPGLPRSLEEPLTATGLEDFGLLLAWLALACLALLVLVRALRPSSTHSWPRTLDALNVPGSRPSGAKGSRPVRPARHPRPQASTPRSSTFPEQFVLTVTAPVETPAPVEQEARAEAAEEAPSISVSVLGPLQITGGKRRRRPIRASAQELIAYLAFHPEGASRDQLLEALWPGEDPKRSEQRLWQSTTDARRAVGDALSREGDRYQLDRAKVRVDVDDLERLIGAVAGAEDAASGRRLLEQALALFRGEPLEDSDYAWTDGDVRRLRATYVELLARVGRIRFDAGEARAALETAERGLAVDGLNESLWRLALEAESALGLREAVEERYENLRRLLDERLGLEPAQETRLLHRRLLAQH
jgi:DNA-binding SARP family transcriptional activator